MKVFRYLIQRLFDQRPFFYGWEQRDYERRQEQLTTRFQNACRIGRD